MTQEAQEPKKDEGLEVGSTIPLPNGKEIKFNLKPEQEPLQTEDDTPVSSPDHIETSSEPPPSMSAILQKLGEHEEAIAIAMDGISKAHQGLGNTGDEISAIVTLLAQRGIFSIADMKIAVANAQSRRRMFIQNMIRQQGRGQQEPVAAAPAPEPPPAPEAEKKETANDQAG